MISVSNYATESRLHNEDAKLLYMDNKLEKINHNYLSGLSEILESGDVLVINDSGVIPASFKFFSKEHNLDLELRLVRSSTLDFSDYRYWDALIYIDGKNWTEKTENRILGSNFEIGDKFVIAEGFSFRILDKSTLSDSIFKIRFGPDSNLIENFYHYGTLIQYSYLNQELDLWDGQTIFSNRPISVEAPSASFQFTWNVVLSLMIKGIDIVPITHGISISSTGVSELDNQIPLPERYSISETSVSRLNNALQNKRRIIALGTSVMRALESNFDNEFYDGNFITNLRINQNYKRNVVNGLITGMHIPNESHFELLQSFSSKDFISKAYNEAKDLEYKWHEYGDLTIIL